MYVASKWRLINRNVDMFFSNSKYNENQNESSISIYSITTAKEGEKLQNDFDFQLKFDLPQTTKHLKLVIERDQDEIKNAMTDENLSVGSTNISGSGNRTTQRYSAGLNYLLNKNNNFSSMIKFGFRIEMPLNPSLKYTLNKKIEYQFLNIETNQEFILYRQEGFSEITSLNFIKNWNEEFQTHFNNNLAWSDKNDYFQLRNNILLYQDLGDEKSLSYSVGANAKLSPVFNYESYDSSVSYRQKLYGTWLYGAFTVGAEFLKEKQFRMDKFIQLRFEIFFK